jgi:hypothetical protein
VLVKGYSEPLGWTLPIVAIGLYNLWPLDDHSVAASVLLGVLGAALLFCVVMGLLKRSRSPVLRPNDT